MKLFRTAVAVMTAMLLGLLVAGPANAQYPPTTGTAQVSASTVEAGDPVTFSGSGCPAGAAVTIADNGAVVQTVNADASGNFSTSVTLTTVGTHTLTGTCVDAAGVPHVLSATVQVVEPVAGPLPTTGSSAILPSLLIGLVTVVMGSALVFFGRRRRRSGFAHA